MYCGVSPQNYKYVYTNGVATEMLKIVSYGCIVSVRFVELYQLK